jgi:hypothetical protein
MANMSSDMKTEQKDPSGIVDRFTEWSLNWVSDSMVFSFVIFAA